MTLRVYIDSWVGGKLDRGRMERGVVRTANTDKSLPAAWACGAGERTETQTSFSDGARPKAERKRYRTGRRPNTMEQALSRATREQSHSQRGRRGVNPVSRTLGPPRLTLVTASATLQ